MKYNDKLENIYSKEYVHSETGNTFRPYCERCGNVRIISQIYLPFTGRYFALCSICMAGLKEAFASIVESRVSEDGAEKIIDAMEDHERD